MIRQNRDVVKNEVHNRSVEIQRIFIQVIFFCFFAFDQALMVKAKTTKMEMTNAVSVRMNYFSSLMLNRFELLCMLFCPCQQKSKVCPVFENQERDGYIDQKGRSLSSLELVTE